MGASGYNFFFWGKISVIWQFYKTQKILSNIFSQIAKNRGKKIPRKLSRCSGQ
jgi:hypothetical protein